MCIVSDPIWKEVFEVREGFSSSSQQNMDSNNNNVDVRIKVIYRLIKIGLVCTIHIYNYMQPRSIEDQTKINWIRFIFLHDLSMKTCTWKAQV